MSVRTLITKSRKRFEDAVGPKEDHATAFHMFADRDDILHLSYQETVAWALECHDRAKQPVRIEFPKPTEPKKVSLEGIEFAKPTEPKKVSLEGIEFAKPTEPKKVKLPPFTP